MPGAVALNGIKESLDVFNNTIKHGLAQPEHERADTSPERRSKAMDRVQELEAELDDARLVALIDLFQTNTSAADAYMTLKREALRKVWVQRRLKDLGFPDDLEIRT